MNADGERRGGAVCNRDTEFVGSDTLFKCGFIRRFKTVLAYPLEGNFGKWLGGGFEGETAPLRVGGKRFESDEDFLALAFCKREVCRTA